MIEERSQSRTPRTTTSSASARARRTSAWPRCSSRDRRANAIALFDRLPGPAWHDKLLHPGVRMQTSWLKDLVSMVDPTHPLSFLNYLVCEGRLFALFNAQFDVIPRREYMRYLAWASAQLPDIHYGTDVDAICFGDDGFVVHRRRRAHRARPSTWCSASAPAEPVARLGRAGAADEPRSSPTTWPTAAHRHHATRDAPVAVVGGGQTGIEAVLRAARRRVHRHPWLGRRQWFETIDDSPVANDVYRPAHQQFLQQLSAAYPASADRPAEPDRRRTDPRRDEGAVPGQLRRDAGDGRFPVTLLPGRDVVATADRRRATSCSTARPPEKREEYHVPSTRSSRSAARTCRARSTTSCASGWRPREDGELTIEPDYSVRWKGMNGNRIYALNRARLQPRHHRRQPDPAAGALGHRPEQMYQRQLYTVKDELCPVHWG